MFPSDARAVGLAASEHTFDAHRKQSARNGLLDLLFQILFGAQIKPRADEPFLSGRRCGRKTIEGTGEVDVQAEILGHLFVAKKVCRLAVKTRRGFEESRAR